MLEQDARGTEENDEVNINAMCGCTGNQNARLPFLQRFLRISTSGVSFCTLIPKILGIGRSSNLKVGTICTFALV